MNTSAGDETIEFGELDIAIAHWHVNAWGGAEYLVTKLAEAVDVDHVYTLGEPDPDDPNPYGSVTFEDVTRVSTTRSFVDSSDTPAGSSSTPSGRTWTGESRRSGRVDHFGSDDTGGHHARRHASRELLSLAAQMVLRPLSRS